jgi:hypothetical protein
MPSVLEQLANEVRKAKEPGGYINAMRILRAYLAQAGRDRIERELRELETWQLAGTLLAAGLPAWAQDILARRVKELQGK